MNEIYEKILYRFKDEFSEFENEFKNLLNENQNELSPDLIRFIFSPSKRIRPLLCVLFSYSVFDSFEKEAINIALISELIHTASLIHDDIVDESQKRRSQKTLGYKYDSKIAVLGGDFLLSLALKQFCKNVDNSSILLFSNSISQMTKGEIWQYFNKHKVSSLDNYILYCKQKTAELFYASIASITKDFRKKEIEDFAYNFGIAFQIKDDIKDALNNDQLKSSTDIEQGVYTAPLIFASMYNLNIEAAIEKSFCLLDHYIKNAIDSLSFMDDNIYKKSLIELCEFLRKR